MNDFWIGFLATIATGVYIVLGVLFVSLLTTHFIIGFTLLTVWMAIFVGILNSLY